MKKIETKVGEVIENTIVGLKDPLYRNRVLGRDKNTKKPTLTKKKPVRAKLKTFKPIKITTPKQKQELGEELERTILQLKKLSRVMKKHLEDSNSPWSNYWSNSYNGIKFELNRQIQTLKKISEKIKG